MAKDIIQELSDFEDHCVDTEQMQVAELAHEAKKEIWRLRERREPQEDSEPSQDEALAALDEMLVTDSHEQRAEAFNVVRQALQERRVPDKKPTPPGEIIGYGNYPDSEYGVRIIGVRMRMPEYDPSNPPSITPVQWLMECVNGTNVIESAEGSDNG